MIARSCLGFATMSFDTPRLSLIDWRAHNTRQHNRFMMIAGVDEFGRGSLVGDVVAAAAILDPRVSWIPKNSVKQSVCN